LFKGLSIFYKVVELFKQYPERMDMALSV